MTRMLPTRALLWIAGATVALLAAFVASLSMGAVSIPISEVIAWVTGNLSEEELSARVLAGVRFPRTLGAVVVGSVLAAAGASLQGIHRTRVVDAHLMGISAAAGLGVAIGAAAVPAGNSPPAIVVIGVLFGGGYALASRFLGRAGGGTTLVVLMGIAAGFAMTAWTGVFVLGVDDPAVPTLSFFIFGSLVGAQPSVVIASAVVVAISLFSLWWMGPGLDLLSLGDRVATHIGFDARQAVPVALVMIGAGVGASVAVGGVIGFVGLVVPALVRPLVGVAHRVLIPMAALSGATLVVLTDVLARTLLSPIEIPIGLITAGFGAPVLIWMVRREVLR